MKALSRAFLILVFGILYIPMAVLVLFSFKVLRVSFEKIFMPLSPRPLRFCRLQLR